MNRWIVLSLALVVGAASGQKIYKCPGPDGKVVYQQQQCQEGERMIIRDNGSGSSGPETAGQSASQPGRPSASPPESGLRESEKEMLRDVRQREEADANRRHEQALQAERADVAKEAIRAEKAYQAQLRTQHCARYPNSTSCR